jgi:hypothetical protein
MIELTTKTKPAGAAMATKENLVAKLGELRMTLNLALLQGADTKPVRSEIKAVQTELDAVVSKEAEARHADAGRQSEAQRQVLEGAAQLAAARHARLSAYDRLSVLAAR